MKSEVFRLGCDSVKLERESRASSGQLEGIHPTTRCYVQEDSDLNID